MISDTKGDYGWFSILMHWTSAILVLVLFFNGRSLVGAEQIDEKAALLATHLSVGGIALLVWVVRFIWRVKGGLPGAHRAASVLDKLSVSLLWLLVTTTLVLALSGLVLRWAGGDAVPLVAGIHLPSPIGPSPHLREAMLKVHLIASDVIIALFFLHMLSVMRFVAYGHIDVVMRILRVKSDRD